MQQARHVAELTARTSYGRLLAYLVARTGDITLAEDALGDAFLAALQTWGEKGTPVNPEAWLLLTAKRKLLDRGRHRQVNEKVLHLFQEDAYNVDPEVEDLSFPDERLKLLFVCAHPAIDAAIHTPLMLQTVLGLNAQQIASAFLVTPSTMGQRLVRAKAKIRDAGIAFEIPAAQVLSSRLEAVLEAIYAAYNCGWDELSGRDGQDQGLTEAALWLARLCTQLLPQEPEARGLLALLLYCEARRPARRSSEGRYIPLSEQDPALWSEPMLQEAEQELLRASLWQQWGRFQLEAAIQSFHSQRIRHPQQDWESVLLLYQGLLQICPTIGAQVSYAAAMAEARGSAQGLAVLQAIPGELANRYQPYWAVKAHLLQQLSRSLEAKAAYQRAMGLCENAAVRDHLMRSMQAIS